MKLLKDLLILLLWATPHSAMKVRSLRRVGHHVDTSARISSCLVWRVGEFSVGKNAVVRKFNVFKSLKGVWLDDHAIIGVGNLISAAPVFAARFPDGQYGRLVLRRGAKISSRHILDCSAEIEIGEMSSVAGHGSTFLTHSTRLEDNAQTALPIRLGAYVFVGTNCLLMGGAILQSVSVLGAGSTLLPARAGGSHPPGLLAGSPAVFKKSVSGAWFTRTSTRTTDVVDVESGARINNAF